MKHYLVGDNVEVIVLLGIETTDFINQRKGVVDESQGICIIG